MTHTTGTSHAARAMADALQYAGITPDDPEAPAKVTRNAQAVLERRYLKKDAVGRATESADDMYRRVAKNLAQPDANHGASPEQVAETEEKFYRLMASNRALPNSPTLMNAGRELQQLSACFVLPVPDDLEGIFTAVLHTAIIHKSGGGTGFDFSNLRPEGDPVGSTNGVASGPVSFIDAFDAATDVVKQGGTRRGANMGILRVDHPDILKFINRKRDGSKLQNFNISVAATDEFMKAVQNNTDYDLYHPKTGRKVRALNAAAVMERIVENAWATGDPGLIFIDAINRENPNLHTGAIAATNPCVTGDTVVATAAGPRTVAQLVGRPFTALVDGQEWPANPQGFFYTGRRRVMRLTTDAGHSITLTPDHRLRVRTPQGDQWKQAADVRQGDLLTLNRTDTNEPCRAVRRHFQRLANNRGTAVFEAEITDTSRNPVAAVAQREYAGWSNVYDCQIPGINAFDGNGLYVHQCGEQPLGPYESCNLASINLARHVRYNRRDRAYVLDYPLLEHTVFETVHLLDNVIDANRWPLPEVETASLASRRIGLGVMGFADLLIVLGIPYDSPAALELADTLVEEVQRYARAASQELAKTRGAYPNYSGSEYEQNGVPPMRNTAPVTIAPTGTISVIAGASSGIEPLFGLAFRRNVMDRSILTEFSPLFQAAARHHGFDTPELMAHVEETGDLEHPDAPEWARELFRISHQIPPLHHVAVQAAFQKNTDNAVSKTINMPNHATKEDVAEAYRVAWESGCKGITVYRDGSKPDQVLSTGSLDGAGEPAPLVKRPRPKMMSGVTININTGHGACYVTINADSEQPTVPFEVFANMGKAGSCDSANIEAICRLASTAFRAGVSSQEVVDQLDGITCHPYWEDGRLIRSTPDAIAAALDIFMNGESNGSGQAAIQMGLPAPLASPVPQGPPCPDCGNAVQVAEGCATCFHCGWSQCEGD